MCWPSNHTTAGEQPPILITSSSVDFGPSTCALFFSRRKRVLVRANATKDHETLELYFLIIAGGTRAPLWCISHIQRDEWQDAFRLSLLKITLETIAPG